MLRLGKKSLIVVSLAMAVLFSACNPNSGIEAKSSGNADVSRAMELVTGAKRIVSDLNPGYGNAVFFTGTFEEGKDWTVAVRGSYDNGWYADVHSSSDFEWKALTGSYSLGDTVVVSNNLVWESGSNHSETVNKKRIYVLTRSGNAKYGANCYFTGTFDGADNWSKAIEADFFTYSGYKFVAFVTSESEQFEWKTLSCFGSLGATVSSPFNGLNWDSNGENLTQDNALSFEEYWAENTMFSYFIVSYDSEKEIATFMSSNAIYGYNSIFQDKDATILEIVNNDTGDLIFSGKFSEVEESGIHFDRNDETSYTATLYAVSKFGDLGTPYDYEFTPAEM